VTQNQQNVLIAQLPSPPGKNVFREWSGGMGTAVPSAREHHGHDPEYYDVPYFSFLYIARGLEEKGISVVYRDYQASAVYDPLELERVLREESPRFLVTVISLPSLTSDLELLRGVRDVLPEIQIILLGPPARLQAERLLTEGLVDFIIEANEELAVPEMIANLIADKEDAAESCFHLRDGVVVQAPPVHRMKNLDFVEFPAYELLDASRYESDNFLGRSYRYMTVYSSKGCGYSCEYCPYPYGFGSRFLFRSPELIVSDIERLVREFGVEQICFRDQVFTVNRKHAIDICDLLIERSIQVVWICETRYDVVDPDLLERMYRAGCREIHYGLETADAELFESVAKPGGPVSLDRFADAVEMTKKAGLRVHLHLILGLPGESWKTVRRTIAFLRKTRPFSVQTAIFTPYPGTPIHDRLREEGKLASENWEDYSGFQAVQPTEWLTVEELERAREFIDWNWDKSWWDKIVRRFRLFLSPTTKTGTRPPLG
jgi:anaerobic magnesium-protoporphyrin IX monomethyl ester cyclase